MLYVIFVLRSFCHIGRSFAALHIVFSLQPGLHAPAHADAKRADSNIHTLSGKARLHIWRACKRAQGA